MCLPWMRWMAAAAIASLGFMPAHAADTQLVGIEKIGPIEPSSTGKGIGFEFFTSGYHVVYLPSASLDRKSSLVVFMGGSFSSPAGYTDISQQAAKLGYGVLDLRYQSGDIVALACGSSGTAADNCYTQYRGDIVFGNGVAYNASIGPYSYPSDAVTPANSVVNRLVNLIDWLAINDKMGGKAYWSQFLVIDASSPYSTIHYGHVYPDWSKIIIAGHSQGGGHAAFLASKLAVRRAVLFSAPNDGYNNGSGLVSASWITADSATAPSRYWGLRNANEGIYGQQVAANWSDLGTEGLGGSGNAGATANVGDGSGVIYPPGAQRLMSTVPNRGALVDHGSTAANGAEPAGIDTTWDYLFSANGTD